jgi:hypothetical protein
LAFPPEVPSSIELDCTFWFPGWMITVALPDEPLKTALTAAVVVTLPPLPSAVVGTPLGATYNPLAEMNPTFWLPPAMPLTSQVTAVLGDPFTVAVNCCVPKFATVAALGETLTELEGVVAVSVTVADADFVESAWEVAVTLTVAGFGTVAGAVYKPVVETLPFKAPPATSHVTAVFDVPATVAVNCCVFPTLTLTAVGATATETALGVLLAEPAQPTNRAQTQLRVPEKERRMRILTGGVGPRLKCRNPKADSTDRIYI